MNAKATASLHVLLWLLVSAIWFGAWTGTMYFPHRTTGSHMSWLIFGTMTAWMLLRGRSERIWGFARKDV